MRIQRIICNSAVVQSFVFLVIVSAVAIGGISNILGGLIALQIGFMVFSCAFIGFFTFVRQC